MKKGTPAKGKPKNKSSAIQNSGASESAVPPKTPDMSKIRDILLRNPKPLTPVFTPRKAEDRTPRQKLQDLGTPVHVKKQIPKPKISVVPSTPVVCEFTHTSPKIATIDVATSPFAAKRQATPIPPAGMEQTTQETSNSNSSLSVLLYILLIALVIGLTCILTL